MKRSEIRKLWVIAIFILVNLVLVKKASAADYLDSSTNKLNREGRLQAIKAVEETVAWLQRSVPGEAPIVNNGKKYVRRHGMRKKIMTVQSVADVDKSEIYKTEVVSGRVCHSIHYLIRVGQSSAIKMDTRETVAEFAKMAIDNLQVKSGKFKGGFYVSEEYPAITTASTAICGLYLLKAYEFFKAYNSHKALQTKLLAAAKDANSFLSKMENPSLISGYEDFRFVDESGARVRNRGVWLDGVINNRLVVASTAWNFVAFALREKLAHHVPAVAVSSSIKNKELQFYLKMGREAYEGYAPQYDLENKSSRKSQLISSSGMLSHILSFDNNQFLRRYGNSSIGSDMAEYIIVSLREAGYVSQTRELFNRYTGAHSVAKVDGVRVALDDAEIANAKIDPFVGYSGIYFIGSHDPSTGVYAPSGSNVYLNYEYYDFDAIIGDSKNDFYPCRVQKAVERILQPQTFSRSVGDSKLGGLSHLLYASLDLELRPLQPNPSVLDNKEMGQLNNSANAITWEADESIYRFTRAASTVAHNGTYILTALESAYNSRIQCN